MSSPSLPRPRPKSSIKPWGWPAWLAWSVLLVASVTYSAVAGFVIAWGAATTCGELPTRTNLLTGQRDLALAAVFLAAPWLLGVVFSPRRWPRLLAGYLIGCVPLAAVSLTHLHVHDWTSGFCF